MPLPAQECLDNTQIGCQFGVLFDTAIRPHGGWLAPAGRTRSTLLRQRTGRVVQSGPNIAHHHRDSA